MMFHSINNYSVTTTSSILAGDLQIPLAAGLAAALESERTTAGATYIALTMTDEGDPETVEIIYVTGATGDSIDCLRAREDTTALAWPSGTVMEARVTAAMMNDDSLAFNPFQPLSANPTYNVVYGSSVEGRSETGDLTTQADWDAYAAFTQAMVDKFDNPGDLPTFPAGAVGNRTLVSSIVMGSYMRGVAGENLVCIGYNRGDTATDSVFVGATGGNEINTADAFVPEGITVVGGNAGSGTGKSTMIGFGLYQPKNAVNSCTTAVGASIYTWDATAVVAVGANQYIAGNDVVCIGGSQDAAVTTEAESDKVVVVGGGAKAGTTSAEAITLGYRSEVNITGMARIAALPYLPAAVEAGTFTAPAVCRQNTAQVAMATPQIDLTNNSAVVQFALPAGVTLFPDGVDVVIDGSVGATNAATINVGTDAGNPATLVSAQPLDSAALASRTVFDPLSKNGITSVYVSLTAANTGTTSTAKIVVRGYVMEL